MAFLALVGALALAACGGDSEAKVQPYDHAPVPAVPDRTHEVAPNDTQPDGDYWATVAGADVNGTIDFRLEQAFFGPTCAAVLGVDQCDGDMGVKADPSVVLRANVATLMSISVAAPSRQNYAVPGTELIALLMGQALGPRAPEGFALQPYPFLITIEGGVVTAAHQIWMP